MSWTRALVATLVGLALVTSVVTPAGATYPGRVGRIAVAINVDGTNPDIYSIRPDGTGLRQLTTHAGFDACPSYSATGQLIAFCSDRADPGSELEIWTMHSDGSRQRRLTRLHQRALFPDISPDGRKVAFDLAAAADTPSDIWTIDSDGRHPRPLTSTPDVDETLPVWSPDGRWIAFLKRPVNTQLPQLWLMDRHGRHQRQLTFDPVPKGQLPDWRPDGKKIAYSAGENFFDTFLINPDGTGQMNITNTPDVDETGTAWSPDGRRIAYLDFVERRVYTMGADGQDVEPVGPATGLQFVPGWQPKPLSPH